MLGETYAHTSGVVDLDGQPDPPVSCILVGYPILAAGLDRNASTYGIYDVTVLMSEWCNWPSCRRLIQRSTLSLKRQRSLIPLWIPSSYWRSPALLIKKIPSKYFFVCVLHLLSFVWLKEQKSVNYLRLQIKFWLTAYSQFLPPRCRFNLPYSPGAEEL